jgi:glycerophosphoryl diester phosphodiesterase
VALAGTAAFLSYSIISQIWLDENIAVTAHLGSSLAAPENTMAAILRAIQDGADYAETDVQETADGVIVLYDLRRVAGVDSGIWELTYDEVKELDVGSWFSGEFTGERVVPLRETMQAGNDRIKLNIELKYHGHNRRLEAEVARLVTQAMFEDQCIVTSLEYGGMQEIARQDSRLRRGLIVTAKIGDATKLDIDLLAVNARSVTRDLVARAHEASKEMHVWTVNDP